MIASMIASMIGGGERSAGPGRALALLAGVLGLTGQALLRPRLEARQVEAGVVVPGDEQAGMSADMAVPVLALGAFRGLVVDYLWLRSISFRERGRVYEARQVAEQICRLQPRLPDVWAFLGHDLAYNVAAAVDDPEARWRWIQNGIALLRDQGLRYNPGDPDLCFMLARTFQDKLGTTTDDHHMLYKVRHADLMERALGDTSLADLAAAPAFEALEDDPTTRPLVAQLAARGVEGAAAIAELAATPVPDDELAPLRAHAAWPRVVAAARAHLLRAGQRMDPERMLALDRRYGPLDWRGCDAATVYWADVGLEGALRRGQHRDAYALRRTIHAGLKNAVRRGRLERLGDEAVFLAPMPELVFQVDAYLREGIEEATAVVHELEAREARGALPASEEERLDAATIFERNQRDAREGFLCEAIVLLAEYGDEAGARRAHALGRRDYPDAPMLQLPYEEFVLRVYAQRFVAAGTFLTRDGMAQTLQGTWVSAYTALAMGQDDRYRGLEALARGNQARWQAYLASLDEPDARARLGLRYEDVRRASVRTAAEGLPAFLQERLAERLGITREALLRGDLSPRGQGDGGDR